MGFPANDLVGDRTPAPASRRPEREQRLRWLAEVWSNAGFMGVALGLVAVLLTGDALLALPIAFVCLLVGVAGTILVIQRSRPAVDEHPR